MYLVNWHRNQFGYNRSSQVTSRTLSNDAWANVNHYDVNRPYTVNGLNQYTTAGSGTPITFAYDANGNLTSDSGTTFAYDNENRLVSATGSRSATLVYDPMGRLATTDGGTAGLTRFLYDGDALVAEYNSAGTLIRRYVHGTNTDEPLVWYEGLAVGSSTRSYLHANHQGSIVAVANSSGQTIGLNAYDAWGIANDTNIGRFAYTGQIAIPELGLYHYKARLYSPTLGRFLQTDPIGYEDQMNLYAYVANDPVRTQDPSGREIAVGGTQANREQFVQFVQRQTGVSMSIDSNNRLVAGQLPSNPNHTAITVVNAIQSSATISMNIVNAVEPIIYDSFFNVAQPVDIADLAAAESLDPAFGGAVLTHIVAERSFAAENGLPRDLSGFLPSHGYAVGQESAVMGAVNRTDSTSALIPNAPVPGDTLTVTYTDANGNVVSTRTLTYDDKLTPR